jgi:hypothetical protein
VSASPNTVYPTQDGMLSAATRSFAPTIFQMHRPETTLFTTPEIDVEPPEPLFCGAAILSPLLGS